MRGIKDARAAAIEAREEAGVAGKIGTRPLGSFDYLKQVGSDPIKVTTSVFPLRVCTIWSSWKEKRQRKRKWMPIEQAARELDDAGLRALIQQYSKDLLSVS